MTDLPPSPDDAQHDQQDAAPLFQAINASDAATVTDLIEARPALHHSRSPSGLSPLLYAAYYRRPEMARLLLDLGAPASPFEAAAAGSAGHLLPLLDSQPGLLGQFSPDGFSLLGLCAFFGHDDLAASLLARGAEVNAPSRNSMAVTPLHSAAAGRHLALALALLRAGAEVNARQHGGYTPLMGAAQNGDTELARALLAAGADCHARNEAGQRAADLAREDGHHALADLCTAGGPATADDGLPGGPPPNAP
jgi:uncharacterized protein